MNILSKDMKWNTLLKQWHDGYTLTYPENINRAFFWETSPITLNDTECKQHFIESEQLDGMSQNYIAFIDKIKKSKNKFVTSFYNKSGDTLLVIPMPKRNKNYATLKDFIDNAHVTQQIAFWKEVSRKAKLWRNSYGTPMWISTHGTGVPYLHVRISSNRKYHHI